MKKSYKKILALTLVMLLALAPMVFAVESLTPAEAAHLSFGNDKNFTILQVSDIQDGPGLRSSTAKFLKKSLEDVKPDLVVLTGDNISGGNCLTMEATAKAIDKFMSIYEAYGVPVVSAFGNHDSEGVATREEQMAMYESYSCFIGFDEGPALSGTGTYNVPIFSSTDSEKVAYNLWVIDSGDYDEINGGYAHVQPDQIDWYVNKSNQLKAANGGTVVNSMLFQHIIVPEIYDALIEVKPFTNGSVPKNGKHYILDPEVTRKGVMGEGPCPPTVNGRQFDAIVNQGDVVAMFFGHDHTNSFEVSHMGLDLVCTPTAGLGSYGDRETRGARVITINEDRTHTYDTYLVRYDDYLDFDSLINFDYKFLSTFWDIVAPVMQFVMLIESIFSVF
ncbi:MAG: hypothetical protein GX345_09005 [Clostridiales bacterium]|nr:hypothetical protein [Clostridiales bacterium]